MERRDESTIREQIPEIRIRSVLISILVGFIFAAANCYLTLYSGINISVSIPAAVISIAILKPFGTNPYEINAVQTGASAGSALVSGIVFTLPALVINNYWEKINIIEGIIVGLFGGFLGVLFSIPLRAALIRHANLIFPEGLATTQILFVSFPNFKSELQSNEDDNRNDGDDVKQNILSRKTTKFDDNEYGAVSGIDNNSNNDEKVNAPQSALHPQISASSEKEGLVTVAIGIIIGFIVKGGSSSLMLWKAAGEWAFYILDSPSPILWAVDFSPALLGVGYIVGIKTSVCLYIGSILSWWFLVPFFGYYYALYPPTPPLPEDLSAVEMATYIWSEYTRFIGVGAMLVGGIATLFFVLIPLITSLRVAFQSFSVIFRDGLKGVKREDRDIPIPIVLVVIVFSLIPLYFLFVYFTKDWAISIVVAILMLIFGMIFSIVGAYMAGVVGSSSSPISGITLATIITSAFVLLIFYGTESAVGSATSILIGSIICCAAALSGDNMQDLKVGDMIKSTPYKLQIMQLLGMLVPAITTPMITSLVLEAYGLWVSPQHPNPLSAPQANLIADVAQAIFFQSLPVEMIIIGCVLALIVIIIDIILMKSKSSFRLSVLALALGLYLPMPIITCIFLGGVASLFVSLFLSSLLDRKMRRSSIHPLRPQNDNNDNNNSEKMNANFNDSNRSNESSSSLPSDVLSLPLSPGDKLQYIEDMMQSGVILSAGYITGEALCGILTAIPIVISGDVNVLALFGVYDSVYPGAFSLLFCGVVLVFTPIRKLLFRSSFP